MRNMLLAVFFALSLAGGSARAQDAAGDSNSAVSRGNPAILAVNNSVSLAYLVSRIYYAEPNGSYCSEPAGYCDKETGNTVGGRIAVSYMGSVGTEILDNIYFHGEWSGAEGLLDYNGYYLGTTIPAYLKSRATTQELNFRIGKGFAPGKPFMLTPYLCYGRRYWMRELGVGTTGDYVESYNFNYYGFGSLLQYSPWERLVLTADGTLGKTDHPWINVGSTLVHAGLGQALIKKFGADIDYRFAGAFHFFTGFDYTYFVFGQSAIQATGYLEPYSRTTVYNYTFGFRWTFSGNRSSGSDESSMAF